MKAGVLNSFGSFIRVFSWAFSLVFILSSSSSWFPSSSSFQSFHYMCLSHCLVQHEQTLSHCHHLLSMPWSSLRGSRLLCQKWSCLESHCFFFYSRVTQEGETLTPCLNTLPVFVAFQTHNHSRVPSKGRQEFNWLRKLLYWDDDDESSGRDESKISNAGLTSVWLAVVVIHLTNTSWWQKSWW